MPDNISNQYSVTFCQYDLHLLVAAYHELDYVCFTETGDLTPEIRAFDQFGQELIRAVSDDPEIGPVDILSIALGTERNSVEITMDAQIIRQFIDACLRLENKFAAKVRSRPFDEVAVEGALGDLGL